MPMNVVDALSGMQGRVQNACLGFLNQGQSAVMDGNNNWHTYSEWRKEDYVTHEELSSYGATHWAHQAEVPFHISTMTSSTARRETLERAGKITGLVNLSPAV